jgi:hypothetical protein
VLVRAGIVALSLLLIVATAATSAAQFRRGRALERSPRATTFGNGFNFCRGVYTQTRSEPGGQGWSTDYPDADLNFSIRLGELTRTRVKLDSQGRPDHVTVRLTSDDLFQCPYLHMEDVGTLTFNEREVEALRAWLLKGGFLWVDDFWGSAAWEEWVEQISRVLPPQDYPIRDLAMTHPLFRVQFDVDEFPQIPSIQAWRGGVETSERGPDSAEPHARAISDGAGRIMVLMTHNTDIGDSWEREGEDREFFELFSPRGYSLGINVVLYVLTH